MQFPRPVMHGVCAVCSFGCCPTARSVSAGEIADRTALPANQTAKILRELAVNGLLEARQGRRGGFRLARPLSQITVADVARALGFENHRKNVRARIYTVDPGRVYAAHESLRGLRMRFWDLMENETLASLIGPHTEAATVCV